MAVVSVNSVNQSDHLKVFDNHVEIQFSNMKKDLKLYYIWLRDNCRCSKCYNSDSNQIISDLTTIPLEIKPMQCSIVNDNLEITWKDDHVSVYSLSWLENLHFPKPDKHEIILWDGNDVDNFNDTRISATNFFKDENGLKHLLTSLKKYGFGFVTDVEPTIEATEEVAKRVGRPKETQFGKMWAIKDDSLHKDIAYFKVALGVHADNTYFSDAAGLQIFHIIETEGIGGESIIVDGFKAAHILKKMNPKHYEILCNTFFENRFIENEYFYYNVDSVFKLHPITKELLQIRYNIYDRAPFTTISKEKVLEFYEAYQNFARIVKNPKNEKRIKLTPGTVIFFDNWRVLHGRTAYKGKDAHESVYSLKWLQNLNQPVPSNKGVILWNANNVASFNDVKISMNDFLKNEDGLRYLLTSLHKYGFGFVTGVEPTLEATEKIATRVSLVKNTFFGDTWHITDYEDKPYADVSYTKKSLSCHTDNTYFSDASGLLVFHILAKDGFGGKTILVDGFKVADTLKEANVSQYELLCNTVMGSHFVDKMFRFYNMDPVIKLHPILKEPLQIRYNTFDRAPLTSLTHENVLSFYEAYQSFGKITNASKSELRLSLSPGTVLFIDNWRVLHGRTAYDGKRVLGGCFLTHDDWRSRARTIGLNCL